MGDPPDSEALQERGAGRPAPAEIAALYHQAFRQFGSLALWDHRAREHPTLAQALIVAERLRREGSMASRPLATRIEAACRAAL